MSVELVLVDGPNVFNSVVAHLLRRFPQREKDIKSYMLSWFDLNRLVSETLKDELDGYPTLGTVAFHSRRALGRKNVRLDEAEVDAFWARQAGNLHTSCMYVDVPGDQQERYDYTCDHCGKPNKVSSRGEKGVDNAMTVYMFESAQQWASLCIFSRDVDFMPAIWALRRRGKQVFVAASAEDRQSAIGRASQHLFELAFDFIERDLHTYSIVRHKGAVDCVLENLQSRPEKPKAIGVVHDTGICVAARTALSNSSFRRCIADALREHALDESTFDYYDNNSNLRGVRFRVTEKRDNLSEKARGLHPPPDWPQFQCRTLKEIEE